jgi:hypothetical protein
MNPKKQDRTNLIDSGEFQMRSPADWKPREANVVRRPGSIR